MNIELLKSKHDNKLVGHFSSIQSRFLAFFMPVILLIMLCVSSLTCFMIVNNSKRNFEDRLEDASVAAVAYFEDFQHQCLNAAITVAKMAEIREGLIGNKRKEMQQTIGAVAGDMSLIDNIQVFDAKGDIVADGLNAAADNYNISGSMLFKAGIDGARIVIIECVEDAVIISGVNPIQEYVGSINNVGVVVTRIRLDDRFTKKIKNMTGIDAVLHTPHKVYTTLQYEDGLDITNTILDKYDKKKFDSYFKKREVVLSNTHINENEYMIGEVPLIGIRGEEAGVLTVLMSIDLYKQVIKDTLKKMALITVGSLIITFLLSFVLTRTIVSPIKKLMKNTERLSKGDLTVEFPSQDRKDEIGELAREFKTMGEFLKQAVAQITDNVDEVNEFSNNIDEISCEIGTLSKAIHEDSKYIAEDAEQQTLLLGEANTKIDDINSITSYTNENSHKITDLILRTTKEVDLSRDRLDNLIKSFSGISETVEKLDSFMQHYNESMKQINSIMDLIDHITTQSKLLAFNTAIESARLGHGTSGFGVLSEEIKKLADESSSASSDVRKIVNESYNRLDMINEMFNSLMNLVNTGSDALEETERTFNNIEESITGVKDMSDKIVDKIVNEKTALNNLTDMLNRMLSLSHENSEKANNAIEVTSQQVSMMNANLEELKRLNDIVKRGTDIVGSFKIS